MTTGFNDISYVEQAAASSYQYSAMKEARKSLLNWLLSRPRVHQDYIIQLLCMNKTDSDKIVTQYNCMDLEANTNTK